MKALGIEALAGQSAKKLSGGETARMALCRILMRRYELLILDDFGTERGSEFAQEQMFHIVDSRYRSQLPMIVTTNLTLDELKEPQDLGRARICDRLLDRPESRPETGAASPSGTGLRAGERT